LLRLVKEKKMYKKLLLIFIILLVSHLSAENVGKISGVITDSESGSPLPGVNVLIEGTYLGASTDLDGYYVILNVPVGDQTVVASFVGYQEMSVKGVTVSVDLNTEVNIKLVPTTLELSEAIVVTAEKELIRRDATNTNIITTSEDIDILPVRGIQNLAGLTAGIVKLENSDVMNIRGGRGGESAVYIDGVLANDPYNKAVRVYLPNEAIEQMSVQTGGFNAEYGEAMSGIIITTTKTGSKDYSASLQVITDEFLGSAEKEYGLGTYSYGYNEYVMSLGGPIIPGYNHTFHFSGSRRYLVDHTPSWGWAENENKPDEFKGGVIPGNESSDWSYSGKAKFFLTEKLSVNGSVTWTDRTYANSGTVFDMSPIWLYNTEHAPEWYTEHHSFNLTLTHTIASNTFYNVRVNYFHTFRENYDRYFKDDIFAYGDPSKNPLAPAGSYEPGQLYNARIGVDFFAPGAQYDYYFKNKTQYIGAEFDLTHQYGKIHTFKTGFGYKYHTLREYAVLTPSLLASTSDLTELARFRAGDVRFYGYDIYGKEVNDGDYFKDVNRDNNSVPTDGYANQEPYHPIIMHAYLQDKIEFDDLVLNLGIRYDRIDPNAWQFKDLAAELDENDEIVDGTGLAHGDATFDDSDVEDSEVHNFISPRIGVSFPVTEKTIFHAQFGKFYQSPQLQDLYLSPFYIDNWVQSGGYFTLLDNPNLKPPKTTAYEIGLKHLLSNFASLSITAFYKETEDLVQAIPIQTDVKNIAFYENGDFGVIRGLDFMLTMRRMNNFAINLNYELQYASGTGSASNSNYDIAWQDAGDGDYPKFTMPLDFAQRHTGSVNVDYRLESKEGPKLFGYPILEKFGANLLFTFNSGRPYTRMTIYNRVPFDGRYDNDGVSETPKSAVNSETYPWNYRFDLKFDRQFAINIKGFQSAFTVYLWIYNVLNTENVQGVWITTGEPGDTGFLSTTAGQEYWRNADEIDKKNFSMREMDYNNYGMPRQIRLGVKWHF
jgi:outer membrane receptor protein involved in Fe transport